MSRPRYRRIGVIIVCAGLSLTGSYLYLTGSRRVRGEDAALILGAAEERLIPYLEGEQTYTNALTEGWATNAVSASTNGAAPPAGASWLFPPRVTRLRTLELGLSRLRVLMLDGDGGSPGEGMRWGSAYIAELRGTNGAAAGIADGQALLTLSHDCMTGGLINGETVLTQRVTGAEIPVTLPPTYVDANGLRGDPAPADCDWLTCGGRRMAERRCPLAGAAVRFIDRAAPEWIETNIPYAANGGLGTNLWDTDGWAIASGLTNRGFYSFYPPVGPGAKTEAILVTTDRPDGVYTNTGDDRILPWLPDRYVYMVISSYVMTMRWQDLTTNAVTAVTNSWPGYGGGEHGWLPYGAPAQRRNRLIAGDVAAAERALAESSGIYVHAAVPYTVTTTTVWTSASAGRDIYMRTTATNSNGDATEAVIDLEDRTGGGGTNASSGMTWPPIVDNGYGYGNGCIATTHYRRDRVRKNKQYYGAWIDTGEGGGAQLAWSEGGGALDWAVDRSAATARSVVRLGWPCAAAVTNGMVARIDVYMVLRAEAQAAAGYAIDIYDREADYLDKGWGRTASTDPPTAADIDVYDYDYFLTSPYMIATPTPGLGWIGTGPGYASQYSTDAPQSPSWMLYQMIYPLRGYAGIAYPRSALVDVAVTVVTNSPLYGTHAYNVPGARYEISCRAESVFPAAYTASLVATIVAPREWPLPEIVIDGADWSAGLADREYDFPPQLSGISEHGRTGLAPGWTSYSWRHDYPYPPQDCLYWTSCDSRLRVCGFFAVAKFRFSHRPGGGG